MNLPKKSVTNALIDNSVVSNKSDCLIDCIANVNIGGAKLIINSEIKIIRGNKYGFCGQNGSGKSTLLKYIIEKKFPTVSDIDIFYVEQEFYLDGDLPIFDLVLSANKNRTYLSNRIEELSILIDNGNTDVVDEFNDLNEKFKINEYDKDESLVRKILFGLGFDRSKQDMKFSSFSGGWKMRVSLARGLYIRPDLLLLDEPILEIYTKMHAFSYISGSFLGFQPKNFPYEIGKSHLVYMRKHVNRVANKSSRFRFCYLVNRLFSHQMEKNINYRITQYTFFK